MSTFGARFGLWIDRDPVHPAQLRLAIPGAGGLLQTEIALREPPSEPEVWSDVATVAVGGDQLHVLQDSLGQVRLRFEPLGGEPADLGVLLRSPARRPPPAPP